MSWLRLILAIKSLCPVRWSDVFNRVTKRETDLDAWEKKLLSEEARILAHEQSLQTAVRFINETRNSVTEYVDAIEKNLTFRRADLDSYQDHLNEKEAILAKIQADINSQKEFMLGNDNQEVKKAIILPAMKRKWEAEAAKVDADRVAILQSTPQVQASIESRKKELESRIQYLKQKPKNGPNDNHLHECESRLKELNEIIAIIDQIRRVHETAPTA